MLDGATSRAAVVADGQAMVAARGLVVHLPSLEAKPSGHERGQRGGGLVAAIEERTPCMSDVNPSASEPPSDRRSRPSGRSQWASRAKRAGCSRMPGIGLPLQDSNLVYLIRSARPRARKPDNLTGSAVLTTF